MGSTLCSGLEPEPCGLGAVQAGLRIECGAQKGSTFPVRDGLSAFSKLAP